MRKKIKYCSENGLMFKFGDKAPYYLEKLTQQVFLVYLQQT